MILSLATLTSWVCSLLCLGSLRTIHFAIFIIDLLVRTFIVLVGLLPFDIVVCALVYTNSLLISY